MKVRCTNCMNVFYESAIIYDEANNEEYCPYCSVDGCLMDIDDDCMTTQEYRKYIEAECERQWNENQAEEYGEWYQQDDDTKSTYYNDMYKCLIHLLYE